MDLIELIQTIEKRPAMYVDVDSAESLHSFISGFSLARNIHGLSNERDKVFTEHFYPWLKQKYQLQSTSTWSGLILQLCASRNTPMIELFMAEFDDFLKYFELNRFSSGRA